jgi:hypothetical protein
MSNKEKHLELIHKSIKQLQEYLCYCKKLKEEQHDIWSLRVDLMNSWNCGAGQITEHYKKKVNIINELKQIISLEDNKKNDFYDEIDIEGKLEQLNYLIKSVICVFV